MKFFIVSLSLLLFINQLVTAQESKTSRKQSKYDEYWAQQEKEEKAKKLFEQGNTLFQQQNLYEAISMYQKIFEIIPKHPQAIAKIKDIEIILANKTTELEIEQISEKFTPIEKLTPKNNVQITLPNSEKKLNTTERPIEQEIDPKPTVESKAETIQRTDPKSEITTELPYKTSQDFRLQLAKDYQEGLTETVYRKGNRTITKRVLVKQNLGDEYLMVVHDWGGIYYFKNGQPVTKFIWDKESLGNP